MKAPKNAWQMLPPPAIRGDPTQALRSIAEFSKGKDHAASMGVLFDLLLRNTETLPFPPAIMQRADSVNTPQEQVQVWGYCLCVARSSHVLSFSSTCR